MLIKNSKKEGKNRNIKRDEIFMSNKKRKNDEIRTINSTSDYNEETNSREMKKKMTDIVRKLAN